MPMSAWIVLSLVAAHVFFVGVGCYAKQSGVVRFPERGLSYSLDDLRKLAGDSRLYVVPLLFPLDLIVMILLAGSLGWAASEWGPYGFYRGEAWHYAALPLAYLVADLAEDILLAALLSFVAPVTAATVRLLKTLTAIKLGAVYGSYLLVAAAAVASVIRYLQA